LRHASARNVVERIFGSLKRHFNILTHPLEYNMDIQARIPPAMAAIHYFILDHDAQEEEEISETPDPNPGNLPAERDFGTLARGPPNRAEKARAKEKRDQIAQEMWDSYQQFWLSVERTLH